MQWVKQHFTNTKDARAFVLFGILVAGCIALIVTFISQPNTVPGFGHELAWLLGGGSAGIGIHQMGNS